MRKGAVETCFAGNNFVCEWVLPLQCSGHKHEAVSVVCSLKIAVVDTLAMSGVTNDGVTNMLHVAAQLVPPTRDGSKFEQ